MDLYGSRSDPTLELMITSILLSILIGVPIGIYSAIRQYSRFDYGVTTVSFIGAANARPFSFGLLLILAFSVMPVLLKDQVPWLIRLPPA